MWGGLESRENGTGTAASEALVVVRPTTRQQQQELLANLRELIVALEVRHASIEREGVHRIAQDAAALRRQADVRIAEIEAVSDPTRTEASQGQLK